MAEPHDPIDDLISQLAGLVGKQAPFREGCKDFASEELILDRTVDTVRYLLIRMPAVMPDHAPLSPREQEVSEW